MSLFTDLVDVAAARLGGTVLLANDEFFAPRRTFSSRRSRSGARGSTPIAASGWTDGRRAAAASPATTGAHSARHSRDRARRGRRYELLQGKLSRALLPRGAVRSRARPTSRALAAGDGGAWTEILPRSASEAIPRIHFESRSRGRVTHLRFNIYPDGGVARLRVYGEPVRGSAASTRVPSPISPRSRTAAWSSACSDMFFGPPAQPHPAGPLDPHGRWLGDQAPSWSRARLDHRSAGGPRDDRADRGGHRSLQGQRPGELLASKSATCRISSPSECRRRRRVDHTAASHAARTRCQARVRRLGHGRRPTPGSRSIPDGGIARLRLFGTVSGVTLTLARLNAMPRMRPRSTSVRAAGRRVGSRAMLARRPFDSVEQMLSASDAVWRMTGPRDWNEAFAHHPRIGERQAATHVSAAARAWSAGEQSAAHKVPRLARPWLGPTKRMKQRFGRIYLVCAAGRSGEELLADIAARMKNDPTGSGDRRGRAAKDHHASPHVPHWHAGIMTRITSHVLDTSVGRPATGLAVRLERIGGAENPKPVASTVTDAGRKSPRLASLGGSCWPVPARLRDRAPGSGLRGETRSTRR